ncbi:YIP1 family protein [Methanofollis ethanolicus]|uniref:YIP1 family protein n=1 Tax=Methanofollis ethanolicus TaxID=488124 RepID=UPI00082D99EB|nr:YIP1 family protein [Methanofollis ethanolicus]
MPDITSLILTDPRHLFEHLKETSLKEDLRVYFTLVLATSVLFLLPMYFLGSEPGTEYSVMGLPYVVGIALATVVQLAWSLINGAVILLVVSLVEHFFLLFVDENRGFERTMKSVVYALVPVILFGWAVAAVPHAGLLLLACFSLITYVGTRVFHEKSRDRAAFVALATGAALLALCARWVL